MILREGFKKGTYFAVHLEDALGYGGLYIFEVAYPAQQMPDNWQFVTDTGVPPESIVGLTKYNRSRVLKDDKVLRCKICISNQTEAETWYMCKAMRRNPTDYTKEELVAYGIVTLPKDKGAGGPD